MGEPDRGNALSSGVARRFEAIPAEVKHLSKRRKGNHKRFPQ